MSQEQTTEGQTQAPNADGGGIQPGQGQRTFTQEELNAIIADRLTRQRAQFADYDALKASAAELDTIKQAQMSELEKAQQRAEQLEAERDAAREQATETTIRSAFIAEAARLGVAHPEDAYLLAELDGVNLDESGKVTGVADALKTLVDGGRLVMARPKAPSLDGGAGSGTRPGENLPTLSAEHVEYAQKMGVPLDAYQRQLAAMAGRRQITPLNDLQQAQLEVDRLRSELRELQAQR